VLLRWIAGTGRRLFVDDGLDVTRLHPEQRLPFAGVGDCRRHVDDAGFLRGRSGSGCRRWKTGNAAVRDDEIGVRAAHDLYGTFQVVLSEQHGVGEFVSLAIALDERQALRSLRPGRVDRFHPQILRDWFRRRRRFRRLRGRRRGGTLRGGRLPRCRRSGRRLAASAWALRCRLGIKRRAEQRQRARKHQRGHDVERSRHGGSARFFRLQKVRSSSH
jgi:hypothetical protein